MDKTSTNVSEALPGSPVDCDIDRRSVVKGMTGGLITASTLTAGGALLGSASVASANPAPPSVPTKVRVRGSVPLLPNLAKVMPEAPVLMDALATEFAPIAAQLATQQSYWVAINGWITDRLSGPIMEGKVDAKSLGEQA
jgi:hypothetical protein